MYWDCHSHNPQPRGYQIRKSWRTPSVEDVKPEKRILHTARQFKHRVHIKHYYGKVWTPQVSFIYINSSARETAWIITRIGETTRLQSFPFWNVLISEKYFTYLLLFLGKGRSFWKGKKKHFPLVTAPNQEPGEGKTAHFHTYSLWEINNKQHQSFPFLE